MTYKKRLREYIHYENKGLLVLFFLLCVASVAFSIIIPLLQSNLINSVEAQSILFFQIVFVTKGGHTTVTSAVLTSLYVTYSAIAVHAAITTFPFKNK